MKRCASLLLVFGCLAGPNAAHGAEAPAPTVNVVGLANVAISQTASQVEANAIYRQGLTAAIADGHEKAEFLAEKTGAKVGSIQQISERGGSIECILPAEEGPLTQYESYKGAQPDFGSVESSGGRLVAAPEAPTAASSKAPAPRKKKRKVKARKAAEAVSCTLSTQVVLSYLLT